MGIWRPIFIRGIDDPVMKSVMWNADLSEDGEQWEVEVEARYIQ